MATTIKMPQLGESVTEGTIERWLVKEGDTVEQYDPLFEVVTDKVNAEVPAEVAGTITKIMVADGETVKVGTPLAEIAPKATAPRRAPKLPLPSPLQQPAAEPPRLRPQPAPSRGRPAAAEARTTQPSPRQPQLQHPSPRAEPEPPAPAPAAAARQARRDTEPATPSARDRREPSE